MSTAGTFFSNTSLLVLSSIIMIIYFVCVDVLLFLFFRVNTFGNKVKVGENEYHAVHEYNDSLRNIFLDDFKHSLEFDMFCKRTGRKSLSYSKFVEGALSCPCIREPTMRVCVDKIETMFTELTTTLAKVNFNNRKTCNCKACANQAKLKEAYGKGNALHCFLPLLFLLAWCHYLIMILSF